ncbi:MAG: D-aminoacylase [Gammaproteobacteria bacterium]|nr:D-aminoacylase [Gammaproteobacteria bacterium]
MPGLQLGEGRQVAQYVDMIIRGASVYDGTGAAAEQADIAIDGEHIARVGDVSGLTARHELEAEGLAVAPGFIDVHTHDDFAALLYPDMGFKLRGGVTTCIVGNCGFGAAPFAEACVLARAIHPRLELRHYEGYAGYFDRLREQPPGVNIGVLAGHGTLRLATMGSADRAPDDAEMRRMKSLLGEALQTGVLGMSSGLIYEPGRYATTDELVELAAEMRGSGGLYATHMRDEGTGLLDSVDEAIQIGRRAGVPVQISHHKASGRESWGLVARSIELIEAALQRGEDVHADQYPYTAGSTILRAVLENGAFLPPSASGGRGGIGAVRGEDVLIASAAGHPDWEGRSIAALAERFGVDARTAAEWVLESAPDATVILHLMDESDVQRVLGHPSTMIGSDGIPTLEGRPHPRLYNSFARVLGHYARDLGVLSLAEAIHRMTGMSARKFGLVGRGVIREGACADLVVFDPATVIDRGTFESPNLYPDGILHVIVNGEQAVRDGALAGARVGQALRRQAR